MIGAQIPKFTHGQRVHLVPCDDIAARVIDIHFYPAPLSIEYDVRYFANGEARIVRAFEDELRTEPPHG